jgi:large subunit ribosomal protein L21
LQSDLKLIRGGPRKLFGTKALYASRSNIIKIKMYAIVEIAGQQFKVEEGKKIFVHRLDIEDGKNIDFDHVLLIEEDGNVTVGEPIVKDASVQAKVIEKVRGEKVIVFKKKRKKGYRIKNGHRQNFTQVEIISINGKTAPKKHAVKKDVVAVAEEPVKEKKAESKKPAAKKPATAAKKTAEKKPAAKKPEAKKPGKGKA